MNIILIGSNGKTGRALIENMPEKHKIIRKIDTENAENFFRETRKIADVLIDFSHRSLTKKIIEYGLKTNTPLVIATTGQTEDELKLIENASRSLPIFKSGNVSSGIASLIESAKKIIANNSDCEVDVIDVHHDRKLDTPSGTALLIAEKIREVKGGNVVFENVAGQRKKSDIILHSLRYGNEFGTHRVIITTPNETIELKHTAMNRIIFAVGAIKAAEFIVNAQNGLYDVCDIKS